MTGFGSFIANRLLHSAKRNTMSISLVSFCFGGRSRLSTCVAQFLRRDHRSHQKRASDFYYYFSFPDKCVAISTPLLFSLHPRLIIFSFFLRRRRRRRRCKDSSSFPPLQCFRSSCLALWSVVFSKFFVIFLLLVDRFWSAPGRWLTE